MHGSMNIKFMNVCPYSYFNFPACKSRRYYMVICVLSGSTIFFPALSHERHGFLRKIVEHKLFVSMSSNTLV